MKEAYTEQSYCVVIFQSLSEPETIQRHLEEHGFKASVWIDPNSCDKDHKYCCEWGDVKENSEPTPADIGNLVKEILPFTTDKKCFLHFWTYEFMGAPECYEKKLNIPDAFELLKAEDGLPRYPDLKVELKF